MTTIELTNLFSNKNIKSMNQKQLVQAISTIEYELVLQYKSFDKNKEQDLNINQYVKSLHVVHAKLERAINKIINKV